MKFSSILLFMLLMHGMTSNSISVYPAINQMSSWDSIPVLNSQIIQYAKSKIGKKVGRGECWDLAAEALQTVQANWDNHYQFGTEVNYRKEPVLPGDIVQFEGVVLNYEVKGMKYTEKMLHHTAIIYEVTGDKKYNIAHQNNGFSGRKVGISPFNLSDISKGKIRIYRPTK